MIGKNIVYVSFIILIHTSSCFMEPISQLFDRSKLDDIKLSKSGFKSCDEVVKKQNDLTYTVLDKAVAEFLLSGKINDLNSLLSKLVSMKCYPYSSLVKLRNEAVSIRKSMKNGRINFKDLVSKHLLNKKMISDENEYFLELLHTTETLIDSINFDTPDSIELLQYMLEHVIELEADGHLTTPDANRIIAIIYEKLGALEGSK